MYTLDCEYQFLLLGILGPAGFELPGENSGGVLSAGVFSALLVTDKGGLATQDGHRGPIDSSRFFYSNTTCSGEPRYFKLSANHVSQASVKYDHAGSKRHLP